MSEQGVVPELSRSGTLLSQLKNLMRRPRLIAILGAVLFVVLGATAQLSNIEKISPLIDTGLLTLVPEKISQNAAIRVVPPEGVSAEMVQAFLTFAPEIPGKWKLASEQRVLYYIPTSPLTIGSYYKATLELQDSREVGEFYVEEDPRIENVFPLSAGEADEYSSITIIFNRPIVPLASLDELDVAAQLPIILDPPTQGRWKWVSTRNLQFIPTSHLVRSAKYTIRVPDIVSVEGLVAKGGVYNFQTRPIRQEGTGATTLRYNQPLLIVFNQPVDLAKTVSRITLQKNGQNMPVIVTYGKRKIAQMGSVAVREMKDPSILSITPATDQFGRTGNWDFNSTYTVSVSSVFPQKGNIVIDTPVTHTVSITDVIESLTATSERTNFSAVDFFDPQGKLWVTFAEEVEISRLEVAGQGLRGKEYRIECVPKLDPYEYQDQNTCEKVPNKRVVGLSFSESELAPGTKFQLKFMRIENLLGARLTQEEKSAMVSVYPILHIHETSPQNGDSSGSVSELVICSNTPIREKSKGGESVVSSIKSTGHMVMGGFGHVYRAGGYERKCPVGTFANHIRYGLFPEMPQQLTLSLTDDFGQHTKKELSFTTGKPERMYMRLQNLQKQYNVTTPERTKLTYASENFTYINMRICKLTARSLLSAVTSGITKEVIDSTNCLVEKSARIELPKKFWVNNFFQIDLRSYFPNPVGNYIVTLSHPDYVNTYDKKVLYDFTAVSVTNLVVSEKRLNFSEEGELALLGSTSPRLDKNLYWVARAGTLQPVVGALITPYTSKVVGSWDDRLVQLIAAKKSITGADGISTPPTTPDLVGVVIEEGIDSTIISDWADRVGWSQRAYDFSRTYMYTDRPIYKPGDTVHIKAIDRIGYDGSYEIRKNRRATVKIRNSAYEEVHTATTTQSVVGTYQLSYTIPIDAPLGTYVFTAEQGSGSFQVEEYRGAAFEVIASMKKDEYIAGDTLEASVEAKYYFGVPLDGGTVEYSITAQDYYFDKAHFDGVQFGSGWYGCYSCGYGDTYVTRGSVNLDAGGKATISSLLDFEKLFPVAANRKQGKIFALHITVKDKSGRSVSSLTSAVVHRGEFYIGLGLDSHFVAKNSPITVIAKTVDTQGKELSVNKLTLEIARTEWESFRRQEVDGGFYWRSEQKRTVLETRDIKTDRKGNFSGTYTPTEVGQYELLVSGRDDRGNMIERATTLYVWGDDTIDIRMSNNESLEVVAEKTSVMVGEKPKIIITSPYPTAKALITVERGKIFAHEVVDVKGSIFAYEVPIKESYAPNVFVSVLLLSPRPELKFGSTEFHIGNKKHALSVLVTPTKSFYLPGEEVELFVSTKDYFGIPTPAEVSISVVDLSVLALTGNQKKDPLGYFYPGFPLAIQTFSNAKNMLYEAEIPTGTKGGGGAEPNDLAKKKRGEFRDTAFWAGDVTTDISGTARIKFQLPDNITRWQVESLGVTADTKVGVHYSELTTKKDVMVLPLFPRFIIPGDQFEIGAEVFNQTTKPQEFSINFDSPTLALATRADTPSMLRVAPGEKRMLSWEVNAPRNMRSGAHRFTLSVKNPEYEDVVTETIPVRVHPTHEAIGTGGRTTLSEVREYVRIPKLAIPDDGEIHIRVNATLAVYLPEAVNSLLAFPYGCSEQVASTISTLAVAEKAMQYASGTKQLTYHGVSYAVPGLIAEGVANIAKNQAFDGGFAYYAGLNSNVYLSESVLRALVTIKEAGYPVSEQMISRAGAYIANQLIRGVHDYGGNWQTRDYVRGLLSLRGVPGLEEERAQIGNRIAAALSATDNWKETIDNASLIDLSYVSKDFMTAKGDQEVLALLRNRVAIDGRGASLAASSGSWYFDTSVSLTARLVVSLSRRDSRDVLIEKLLRYISASKARDGSWGSTSDTAEVIRALLEHMERSGESSSQFTAQILLNGRQVTEKLFTPNNFFDTLSHTFKLQEFASTTTNTISIKKSDELKPSISYYYDMVFRYALPVEALMPRDEGFTMHRGYYRLTDPTLKSPVLKAVRGEVLRGHLTVTVPKDRTLVGVISPIPAGFEIVNFNFATEDASILGEVNNSRESEAGYLSQDTPTVLPVERETGFFSRWFRSSPRLSVADEEISDDAGYFDRTRAMRSQQAVLYPSKSELHNDRVFLFVERLSPGVYTYDYYVRALTPGIYQLPPATVSELYFPEHFGRTRGDIFTVTKD